MWRTTKQSSRITRWFISVCLSVWPSLSWGAWPQEAKLLPDDGAALDLFGSAVSISGDYAIVGSPSHDGLGNMAGAAYIFHWDGRNWTQTHKLEASDGAAGHRFGYSVSLDGFVALVGAPYADGNEPGSGAAYVFRRGVRYIPGQGFVVVWEQEAKLAAPDGKTGDLFGFSVSLEGDLALIGAPQGGLSESGVSYVFRRDETWTLESAIEYPSSTWAGGGFGHTLDLHNGYAIVGSLALPIWDMQYGYAIVYRRVLKLPAGWGWEEESDVLEVLLGQVPSSFPVAMGDGWAATADTSTYRIDCIPDLISCPDPIVYNLGTAYVYRQDVSGWNLADTLRAGYQEGGDYFGRSLAINGDYLAVGIPGSDEGETDIGAVYIYRRLVDTWGKAATLLPSGGGEGDWFGAAVGIDEQHIIVGAPRADDVRKEDCGAAYIFRVCPTADSDGDCQVNFLDFAQFAEQWLQ